MKKILVIDNTNPNCTTVTCYNDAEKMLDAIQHKDIADLEVFIILKEIKLQKRPSIIIDNGS